MSRTDVEDLNKILEIFYVRREKEPFFFKGTMLALFSLQSPPAYISNTEHIISDDIQLNRLLNLLETLQLIRCSSPYSYRRRWHKISSDGIKFYKMGGFKVVADFSLAS